MNTLEANRLNMSDLISLAAKSAVIIALVFAALYGLNAKMTGFIEAERAEQRVKEEERQWLQTDYDRANEDYRILDHYDGQFQEIYEKRVNADYIFIGTSHFTHGVTPEEFEKSGKKFFNFSLNGSNPSYYAWWYNEVFKTNNYVKPKAVIFGVDWFMFDSKWLWRRSEFDYKYLREASRGPASAAGSGEAYEASKYTPYKYSGKWYDIDAAVTYITNRFAVFSSGSRFIELVLPEKKDESVFISGKREKKSKQFSITSEGFRLDLFYKGYVAWQADYSGKHAGDVKTDYQAGEETAFITLLKQFKDDEIPVVFVMAPEYLPGRNAPQFDRMADIIKGIADERIIPFLNYNKELISEINEDYSCFSDWGHLNDAGAHIFSRKLYGDLNKILDFEE